MQASLTTRAMFTDKVAQRSITPIAGIFFSEYIAALDRIVKHSKSIALAEKQPQFWIKRTKLGKHVDLAPEPERSRSWSTPRTTSPASRPKTTCSPPHRGPGGVAMTPGLTIPRRTSAGFGPPLRE
jgi:hypothetical protein